MIKVTIKGDLQEQVAKALETRRTEIEAAIQETAESIRQTARSLVPVSDTPPHIRDQIAVRTEGLTAEVGVFEDDFYYGHFIEFGTSERPARPFLVPAVERERDDFMARLKEAIG